MKRVSHTRIKQWVTQGLSEIHDRGNFFMT